MDDVYIETFKLYHPSHWICPCDQVVSAVLTDLRVVSMGVNSVTLIGTVVGDSCRSCYNGHSLAKLRCAHDISHQVKFKVTDSQWNHAVSGRKSVFVFGALFHPVCIDARNAGVISMDRCCDRRPSGDTTRVVELFSGGISGWSHAIRSIPGTLCHVDMIAAVDSESECVEAYAQTHGAVMVERNAFHAPDFQIPEKHFALCATIGDLSWIHLFDQVHFELGVQSPPCPAWSTLSDQAGVGRDDGKATLHGWAFFAVLGTPVIAMENVAGMKRNKQWNSLVCFITALGYTIRWDVTLDAAMISPQRRDRLLVIATRTDMSWLYSHKCIQWPLSCKDECELDSFQAVLHNMEPWETFAKLDAETLAIYLDPRFVPDHAFQQGLKRIKGDVMLFRLRFPHQKVSCFLASYSHAHRFAMPVLEKGGLFGNLLVADDCIRFFTPTEVAILMGLNHPFYLPRDARVAMRMLGNCITVGHAAICVLNALGFLHPHVKHPEIKKCFQLITQERIHAGNIAWVERDGGYWFTYSGGLSISSVSPVSASTRF
eukprot:Skav230506  [mRNA]  locus=scaffold2083:193975:195679:- [translate_table: standard]